MSPLQLAVLCRLRIGVETLDVRFVPLVANPGPTLASLKRRGLAMNRDRYWTLTVEGLELRRKLGLEEL